MESGNAGGISLRRFARLIGVVPSAIIKARARGVFTAAAVGLDAHGRPRVQNVERAIAEWEASGRKLRVRRRAAADEAPAVVADPVPHGRSAGPADVTLVDATRLAMLERARKLRIANDQAEGRLIELAAADRQAFAFARAIRENIQNVPARNAAELAAEPDAARVYSRLDAVLREALTATAEVMRREEAGAPAATETAR